jgi:uncharacterized membrane protein YvbJ
MLAEKNPIEQTGQDKKKNSKVKLIIGISLLAGVVIVFIVLFLLGILRF